MKYQFFTRSLFVAFCAFFVCTSALAETTAESAVVHLNPFAFKLSSNLDGDVFTVTYYLNAPATNVDVIVDIDNDGVDADDVVYNCNEVTNTQDTKLVKGIYTANISLREKINDVAAFRDKENLRWYVSVKGGNTAQYITCGDNGGTFTALNAPKVTSYSYPFYHPGSVDIDIDPFSKNFGYIYMIEQCDGLTDKSEYGQYYGWHESESKYKGGLYSFDPAFQNIPTLDDQVLDKTYDYANYDLNKVKASRRDASMNAKGTGRFTASDLFGHIRIAYDDQHINNAYMTFANTASTDNGAAILLGRVNTANFPHIGSGEGDWFTSLAAGNTAKGRYTNATITRDNFIIGPNVTFDVNGQGAALKLLMVSSTEDNAINNRESFRCDEYNLGTGSSISAPNIKKIFNTRYSTDQNDVNYWYSNDRRLVTKCPKYGEGCTGCHWCKGTSAVGFGNAHLYRRLEYDKDGKGFWHVNYRENHTELPSMVHFKYNSTTKRYDVNFAEYYAGRASGAIRYDINQERLAVAGGKPTVRNRRWTDVSYDDAHLTMHPWPDDIFGTYPQKAVEENWITIYTIDPSLLDDQLITNFDNNSQISYKRTLKDNRVRLLVDSVYVNIGFGAHDIAWDYADNLYVAGRGVHEFSAFALPNGGKPVSTPCKDAYRFNTNASQLIVNIYPQNVNCGTVVDYEFQKSFAWYMNGAKYKLEAKPAAGYRFVSWYRTNSQHEPVFAQYHTKGDQTETVQADFGINVHEDTKIVDINSDTDFKAVYVKRDLDDVSYSTICLPFNLETLVGTPYEGASVLEFTSEETSNVNGDNRISLNFTEVTFGAGKGMRAGIPYLIQVKNAVSGEKMFWDVTCPDIDNQGQSIININGTVTFHALLNPTTFTAAQLKDMLFLTADNRLVTLYGQNSVSINGLRGYFTVSGDMSKNAEFVLNLPDKVVTSTPFVGIEETQQPTKYMQNGQLYIQQGEQVYNMNGALVK